MPDLISTVSAPALTVGVQGSSVPSSAMQMALECRTSEGTAVSGGQAVRQVGTTLGRIVDAEQNFPGVTWSYAAASGGITDTSDVTVAASVLGSRHYIKSAQIVNKHATVTTEVVLKSAATVLWRIELGPNEGIVATFSPPLRCTASDSARTACITTGAKVYVNAQGYYSKE